MPLRRSQVSLAWGSYRASAALAAASTGWLLSGLSASPFLNGLLLALVTAGSLLAGPQRSRRGGLLQLIALLLLLSVALAQPQAAGQATPQLAVAITLAAATLRAIGDRNSLLCLQRRLWSELGTSPAVLRSGREIGQLLGHLLTALLFPLGRASLQFAVALLMLLPLFPWLWRRDPAEDPPGFPDPSLNPQGQPAAAGPASPWRHWPWPALGQGLLFGALFALLPLWVRRLEHGSCLDFGMLLAVYGLGRCLAPSLRPAWWPGAIDKAVAIRLPYAAMALLLLASQSLPGGLAVLLFLPFGLLAGLSDLSRVVRDEQLLSPQWERFSALGGLLGSLGLGGLTQIIGLVWALPLLVVAFLLAALLLPVRRILETAP